MPAFIKIDYELPEIPQGIKEDERKYFIRIIDDVRNTLRILDPNINHNLSLEETLRIIEKGIYFYAKSNSRIPKRTINLQPARKWLSQYESSLKEKTLSSLIEELLEHQGQVAIR